jgi:hypothetical protein
MGECRTCLIHHIDECLCVFPKEGTDLVTRILTRENHFNQGREFILRKRASDQAHTGWELKLRRRKNQGEIQGSAQDGEGGTEGVPLSGAEVVAVSTGAKLLSSQPS